MLSKQANSHDLLLRERPRLNGRTSWPAEGRGFDSHMFSGLPKTMSGFFKKLLISPLSEVGTSCEKLALILKVAIQIWLGTVLLPMNRMEFKHR